MTRTTTTLVNLGVILVLACPGAISAFAQEPDAIAQAAAWQPADPADVRRQLFAWLDERQVDEATRAKAAKLWPEDSSQPTGVELLTRLADTVALVDDDWRKLVDLCSKPRTDLVPPSPVWLANPRASTGVTPVPPDSTGVTPVPPLVANNLRLLYGRWLAHESLFDEARVQLDGLLPDDVVDPASLLFYQGVVYHRLLDKEAGLKAIELLLSGADQIPRRYVAVGRLIEADLKGLKVDSLDHIARRMDDIRRRLDLGRTGEKVRRVQEGVIESLDKLIEELEAQRQQASAAGAGNLQPQSPAEESRIVGGKGPGEVTKRDIGSGSGWGDLPPKQREEAFQQIGREFPAHYRDVIEQYFRKLASQGSQ